MTQVFLIPILPQFYFMISPAGVDFSGSWYFFNPSCKVCAVSIDLSRFRPLLMIKYGLYDEANVEEDL